MRSMFEASFTMAKLEYGEAIADYNEAVRLKPDDAGFLSDRGVVYARRGDL